MNCKSMLRGHTIVFDDEWLYVDSMTPTAGNPRDCGFCGSPNTEDGHDGCLGTLSGVINACCGHGIVKEAYVQFPDMTDLRGMDAITWTLKNKSE